MTPEALKVLGEVINYNKTLRTCYITSCEMHAAMAKRYGSQAGDADRIGKIMVTVDAYDEVIAALEGLRNKSEVL